jgi:hypothetical protein
LHQYVSCAAALSRLPPRDRVTDVHTACRLLLTVQAGVQPATWPVRVPRRLRFTLRGDVRHGPLRGRHEGWCVLCTARRCTPTQPVSPLTSYAVLWQARLVVHDVQSSDADRDDFLFCTAVLETGKPPVVLRVLKSAAAALFDVEGVVGTELAVDGDGDGDGDSDSDSEMDTATGASDAAACTTPDACTAVADAAAGRLRALLTVFDDTTTSSKCLATCPRVAVTYEATGAAVIDHPGCGCDDTGVSNIVEVPEAPMAGASTGAAAVQARAAGATAGGQQRRSVKAATPSTRRFASTMVPATSGALKAELADLAPTLFAWLRGARESVLSVAIAAMELLRLWCRLLAVDDTALEQVAAALTMGDTQCPYSDVMAALKTAEVESVRRILAGNALSTTRTGSCSQFPAASARCLSPTTIHLYASLTRLLLFLSLHLLQIGLWRGVMANPPSTSRPALPLPVHRQLHPWPAVERGAPLRRLQTPSCVA